MKNIQVNSVLAVLRIKDKILLTKRRDIPIWVLPGGKIDDGESAETAIVREAEEETGIKCTIERKVALFTSSSIFIKPVYLYLLSADSFDEGGYDRSEVKEMKLFSIESLPSPLAPLYKEWITTALSSKPYFEKHLRKFSIKDLLSYFFKHPMISIRFLLMRIGIHINT